MSSDHDQTRPDLPSLIGSRICHDLISPIGAVGNGLELLAMANGGSNAPEVALITDSVNNANARIRFFRIAFGQASRGQGTGRAEILSILRDSYTGSRLQVTWDVASECRRDEAKPACLALMCLESAMPFGGDVRISKEDGTWNITGTATKLKIDPDHWAVLDGDMTALTPPVVHFALLPEALRQIDRTLEVSKTDTSVRLTF